MDAKHLGRPGDLAAQGGIHRLHSLPRSSIEAVICFVCDFPSRYPQFDCGARTVGGSNSGGSVKESQFVFSSILIRTSVSLRTLPMSRV